MTFAPGIQTILHELIDDVLTQAHIDAFDEIELSYDREKSLIEKTHEKIIKHVEGK